jgi:phosphoglycolate phosphatase-like HAD superfamily hydrolase
MAQVRPVTPISRQLYRRFCSLVVLILLLPIVGCENQIATPPAQQQALKDPLPSWNDTAPKKNIIAFVERVTKEGSPDFVPVADRIATFDNDGTLWLEYPIYTQVKFALDRVKELAPQHPEWKSKQPFKGVLEDDMKAVMATGEKGLLQIVMATSTGMSSADYDKLVSAWIAQARDKRFNHTYTELIYQPMVELLAYLRANGFKTFIVSGGENAFMRPWTDKAYGIPPDQVVGTTMKTELQTKNGAPAIMRLPQITFVDDGPGKPVGIDTFIGLNPIAAFGNSDGDQQMLEWTASQPGPRFMLLVHHTDAEREYAYDHNSAVGRLDKALDEANAKGWTVVSMKDDWKKIFAFQ